jgi:PAS domain S-box-containing protein
MNDSSELAVEQSPAAIQVDKTPPMTWLITAALAAFVFLLDILAPLDVAGGVPYVILVVYGWWFKERSAPLFLALAGSVLTIAGYFLSPEGSATWIVLTNRFYAILALWVVGAILWKTGSYRSFTRQKGTHSQNLNTNKEGVFFAVLLLVIIASAWGVITRIEQEAKTDIGKSLKTTLETSHIAINKQLEAHKKSIKVWASSAQMRISTVNLTKLPTNKSSLLHSSALLTLRIWLTPVLKTVGYRGFFVIGKDNINLASMRDENIGATNLLTSQGDFLDRVWAGETLVSPPLPSDVPLMDIHGHMVDNLATMFVATPVQNGVGDIIAILAFRLDPDESFSPIFERGRFGETGETYAFDRQGVIISESRFTEQLMQIGLISHDGHSALNIEIRDSGVNLVTGNTPSLTRGKQPLTNMAKLATAGENGSNLTGYRDYRGVPVVGAWLWDDEHNFGITTEVDLVEAFSSFKNVRFFIIVFSSLSIGVLIILAIVSTNSRRRISLSEEKYRTSINRTTEGYWLVDTEGTMLEVNAAFCKMLGYNEDELLGRRPPEFATQESRDLHEKQTSQIATSNQRRYEVIFNRKQGDLIHTDINATTIRGANGKATGAFAFISDITALKEIETAASESEKRFRAVIENAGDAIYIHDRYGKIFDVNQVACDQLGYSRDELLNLSVPQLDVTIDFENLRETWDMGKADPANFPMTIETAHQRKDGSIFPIEVRISLLPSEEGTHFVAMVRDTSERDRAQKQAEQSRRLVQELADNIPEFITLKDTEGRFQFVNKRFEEWTKLKREDVIGKTVHDIYSKEQATLFDAQDQKTIDNNKTYSRTIEIFYPDGETRSVISTRFPITSVDGDKLGLGTIDLNITESVRAQELVKQSEERLISAIDNIADGFVLYDEDDKIIICNKHYRMIYPNSYDQIVPGARFEDIIRAGVKRGEYPEAIGREEEYIAQRMQLRKEPVTTFEQFLNGNRWVRVFDKRLPNGMCVGVRIDITELKEAKEIADNANKAKSEFLSSMSHELRTPMNAILGFGQMLDFNPKEPLTEAQKKCVDHIMKGGMHLLELINDILDLARIEAGKVDMSIEDISPAKVLDECHSLIANLAEKRGITLSLPDKVDDLIRVRADHTRFKQVLLNLMSNAVKYNRDNGTVSVSFEEVENYTLRIAVTDTGEGISAKNQNELFKPFSRLGAENTEIEGTGIGLVVCKDLIELMSGDIGMESKVGTGSTFWIKLPLSKSNKDQAANSNEEISSQAMKDGISGQILYVEDNPDNLMLMELVVARVEGLTMISTHTGELGIEMARFEKPDAIILDINLPGMDGYKVLKKLKSYDDTKNIPVLALSAAATKHDIEKGMEAGFLQYMTKPINVPDVLKVIKDLLEKPR